MSGTGRRWARNAVVLVAAGFILIAAINGVVEYVRNVSEGRDHQRRSCWTLEVLPNYDLVTPYFERSWGEEEIVSRCSQRVVERAACDVLKSFSEDVDRGRLSLDVWSPGDQAWADPEFVDDVFTLGEMVHVQGSSLLSWAIYSVNRDWDLLFALCGVDSGLRDQASDTAGDS